MHTPRKPGKIFVKRESNWKDVDLKRKTKVALKVPLSLSCIYRIFGVSTKLDIALFYFSHTPLAPFKLSRATYLPEKLFHLSNIKYKFLLFVFYLLIDEEGDLKILIGIKGLEFCHLQAFSQINHSANELATSIRLCVPNLLF